MKQTIRYLFIALLGWGLISCSHSSQRLGLDSGHLQPCPESPNCVSSEATVAAQRVAPFELQKPAPHAWEELKATVSTLPRTQIKTATDDYLHAECRSAVFGFIDDLELQLRPQQQQVAVRSAARLGYYDFGVNRKRIEELRRHLHNTGLIR